MNLKPPEADKCHWPLGIPTKGLEASASIFCPELGWMPPMVNMCYACEIGYNGKCDQLTNKMLENPKIISEIYKPFTELVLEELKDDVVFYKGKFYKEQDAYKLKDKSKIYLVTGKFSVKIRFIPKYSKVDSELASSLYAKKGVLGVLSFDDISDKCTNGDMVFAVHQDKDVSKLLEIMEKFNGE